MEKKRVAFVLLAGTLVAALLAGCAAPTPTEAPPPPDSHRAGGRTDGDIDDRRRPTGQSIAFWHAMSSGANLEGMTAVVDAFNASNEYGITVEAVAQGSQSDLETAVNGAIATGELPNLTMGFPNGLVRWHGLGVIAGLNQYIDDPVYGLSDEVKAGIFPGPYSSGTLPDGTQVGIAMHQSAQVMFYNNTWASELLMDRPRRRLSSRNRPAPRPQPTMRMTTPITTARGAWSTSPIPPRWSHGSGPLAARSGPTTAPATT
jgi:ABC-type glycerol-3-phosphate transport system substrate-binding protein